MKQNVYAVRPQNLAELEQRIVAAFEELDQGKALMSRVMHNLTARMLKTASVNGA